MKALILLIALAPFNFALANSSDKEKQENPDLLKQFHTMSITHCDEFITEHTKAPGMWKFFLNKHAGGIDGPSTEVFMVQISGNEKASYKTDYSFIQTLKKCFVHKRGVITVEESCDSAINTDIWRIQYNLPGFDYKRYKDKKGIILYAKNVGKNACLMEYEYRSSGEHSVFKPIK